MAIFKLSFCDPFSTDIIQLGSFSKDDALQKFNEIDWDLYLAKMATAKEGDIHYSPSLQFENTNNKAGIEVSAIGNEGDNLFYVFYFTPTVEKKILGITYTSSGGKLIDLQDQTKEQALVAISALLNEDYSKLDSLFGN